MNECEAALPASQGYSKDFMTQPAAMPLVHSPHSLLSPTPYLGSFGSQDTSSGRPSRAADPGSLAHTLLFALSPPLCYNKGMQFIAFSLSLLLEQKPLGERSGPALVPATSPYLEPWPGQQSTCLQRARILEAAWGPS